MAATRVDQQHPHIHPQPIQVAPPPPQQPPPHIHPHPGLSHPIPLNHPLAQPIPLQPTPADISHHLPPSAQKVAGKKRKKAEDTDPDLNPNAPPARRLRRLHEACARCRSKKIKCDSKLPSCSACTAANVECNQEDRHRQTLKPRGYTDMVETQLAKSILVLEKLVPGFKLSDLDAIMERHDIHVPPPPATPTADASQQDSASTVNPALAAVLQNALGSVSPATANGAGNVVKIEPGVVPGPSSASVSGKPPPAKAVKRGSEGASDSSATVYEDPRRSSNQSSSNNPNGPPAPDGAAVKGQDPQANDLSSTGGLIKAFGVSKAIVKDLPKPDGNEDMDLLGGVRLEDDPLVPQYPKAVSQWTTRTLPRKSNIVIPVGQPQLNGSQFHQSPATGSPNAVSPINRNLSPLRSPSSSTSEPHLTPGGTAVLGFHPSMARKGLAYRLPRHKELTDFVVRKYFDVLNIHRPVFIAEEFMEGLQALYDSLEGRPPRPPQTRASIPLAPQDDPGFLCSVYLILALGRLCIDNEHMHEGKEGVSDLVKDFPTHEEFFELALAVKHDLRVTISSLQALILLHWYLYTERHGRTLWRLVGNLVRLSVELGLHHDPSEQEGTFTPAECEIRIRLWWIVLIHDRGTSVLLGRPLAIADADFNTPFPKRYCGSLPGAPPSEHYDHSPHLTSIQGDIINALYRPGNHKQTADQVLRHAARITNGFTAFSKDILPPSYGPFFRGTENWSKDEKIAFVGSLTEDQGLTFLKYGIARILLLRALFTNSDLNADARRRALKDAVITSHNILTIFQLTSYPSWAFFVSPIPIHIAAMVILYGVISECDALPYSQARDDVCSSLHTVLVFRWRWNRKDSHGSHPLIVRLAQKVFGNDILNTSGPLGPPILIPEWNWTKGQAEGGSPGTVAATLVQQQQVHQMQQQAQQQQQQQYVAMDGSQGAMYGPHPPQQWDGHARHMSNGSGMLPPTPVSATMPANTSPSTMILMQQQGGSPPDGVQHYSPPTAQALSRIDDTDKDTLVRLMYPPPLDQVYYGEDSQPSLGLSIPQQQPPPPHQQAHPHAQMMAASPQDMGPPHTQHIPPPHHPPPPPPPQMDAPRGLPSHHSHHMYASVAAEYNQSATHYVQEEYDGGVVKAAGAAMMVQHHPQGHPDLVGPPPGAPGMMQYPGGW